MLVSNGLLFVAGLDLAKEIFHFRVQFQLEENAIHLQYPLGNQLFPIKLRQILIARIAYADSLRLRRVFQGIAIRKLDV